MVKIRTLLRTGIYLILILFLLFVGILVWPVSSPGPDAIAKRGLTAPETGFSVRDPSKWRTSYGSPRDWMDQGWDAFKHWDMNPWKAGKIGFFRHFGNLARSEDPKDQAEIEGLRKLGQGWYERILARYPELAVQFRDVPDDQNALLRLMNLVQSQKDFGIPRDFSAQVNHKQPWDPVAVKTWMDANRPLMDELRSIGLMTDRSLKGADLRQMPSVYGEYFANAMLLNARLAADSGDLAGCMEMIRATSGMAEHFQQSDFPILSDDIAGTRIQSLIQDYVLTSILPSLPAGQVNLSDWERLLNPTIRQPAEMANVLKANWNSSMPDEVLASLLDPNNPQLPSDPEALAEAYTRHTLAVVQYYEKLALSEMPTSDLPEIDTSGLSWRSRKIAKNLGDIGHFRSYLERAQLQTGMTQAAFAILKGQPVPNDPIYGKPYQWNPETRELALPAGEWFERKEIKPIKLPKLTR